MERSINVIAIRDKKYKVIRYFIRIIENRKSSKKALGIKLSIEKHKKYYNKRKQRFRERQTFPEAKDYNLKIEKYLKDYEVGDGDNVKSISFLDYFQKKLIKQFNHGTRIKKQVVYNKLVKFLKSIDKDDLYFEEITPLLVEELLLYLRTARDPKQLSNNSAIHYLKVIKSILNDAQKDCVYDFKFNPFSSVNLKQYRLKSKFLDSKELEKITEAKISDEKLLVIRNIFLFSIFAAGMRISDVLTLRWSNIRNSRLEYKMHKNNTQVDLALTPYLCSLLTELYDEFPKYEESKKEIKITVKLKGINNFEDMTLDKIEETINNHKFNASKNPEANKLVQEILEETSEAEGNQINYKGYSINKSENQIKNLIDRKLKLKTLVDKDFLDNFTSHLKKNINDKDDFIFPILDKSLFDSNKNFLSEIQYKHIKNKSVVYNRKLKVLQRSLDIETNLTSHVARHTFANLLLEMDNTSIYDISKLLRHSSLSITEKYLRCNFEPKRLDDLNYNLQDKHRTKI